MNYLRTEQPDFGRIHCWECGRSMELYYTIFFIDEDGLSRYGSVCGKCYKKAEDRRRGS